MSRKDMYDVRVTVDGRRLETFDALTGGEQDSDELKYKPGAMGAAVSLGGSVTVGQVVISRLYMLKRDHADLIHWLLGRVGKGKVEVYKQPLDEDKKKFGKPLVYKGILKRVTPPEVDSTSTDPAMLELEMTPEGMIG